MPAQHQELIIKKTGKILIVLTDLLDHEYEALCQLMDLSIQISR
jgi:hypothetical protein